MPRGPRQILPGVPHHLVLRGNNRRVLFSYPRDYLRFLGLLKTHVLKTAVLLHAFCLMRNHVHLFLTPPEPTSCAQLVKGVAQRYAQMRNQRSSASGKLFEQRYFSTPIRSEQHLALVTAYIDLNPVRAGIVEDPAEYRWSSFHVHSGSPTAPLRELWTPSAWYQSLGPDTPVRIEAYHECIAECRTRDAWSELHGEPPPVIGAPPIRPNRTRAAG